MNQFFKEIWWVLRFLFYLLTTKPNKSATPDMEESVNDGHDINEMEDLDTDDLDDMEDPDTDDLDNMEEPVDENNEYNKMRNVVICLDNGHGEETPGKGSPWSIYKVPPEIPFKEYLYCRGIVSRLAQVLHKEGYPVFIVTPELEDITLAERGRRINEIVADAKAKGMRTISISIHNNAAGNGHEWKKAYGWSVWTTRGQNTSDKLAQCLYDAAKDVLIPLGQKTRHDTTDGDDDYESNFAMCRIPNCPAVLTENMFQDCIDEVKFLNTEEGKNAIVEIHRRGINKFIEMMGW